MIRTKLIVTLLLATGSVSRPGFAADYDPIPLPLDIFCAPQGKSGMVVARVPNSHSVPDADSDNVIRKKLAAKISRAYVDPAMTKACADRGSSGWKFLDAVKSTCLEGCAESIGDWPLAGQERSDMLEICRGDCQGLRKSLTSYAFGIQIGRGTF